MEQRSARFLFAFLFTTTRVLLVPHDVDDVLVVLRTLCFCFLFKLHHSLPLVSHSVTDLPCCGTSSLSLFRVQIYHVAVSRARTSLFHLISSLSSYRFFNFIKDDFNCICSPHPKVEGIPHPRGQLVAFGHPGGVVVVRSRTRSACNIFSVAGCCCPVVVGAGAMDFLVLRTSDSE